MSWYYAEDGKQVGPVSAADLESLVARGAVRDDTLVWTEGMANWLPYGQVKPGGPAGVRAAAPAAGTAGAAGEPTTSTPPAGEVVCAECGRSFTRDNAIQYGSVWVCATCKPVFLQKLREGAAPGASTVGQPGAPFDPDAFVASVRETDYTVEIGRCLGRGWELVTRHFWISVGAMALCYVCLFAVSAVPCVGPPLQLVLQGPLLGGLYWFFLKLIRQQEATVADAFAGFSRAFAPLFLVALISGLLSGLCLVPGALTFLATRTMKAHVPWPIIIGAFAAGLIPAVYLTICWMFSMPLVIDKQLNFWTAMEVSRKVVNMHWWTLFLLLLVCVLVSMVGVAALCIGFLVAAPVMMATITYAYEDIFGSGRARIS